MHCSCSNEQSKSYLPGTDKTLTLAGYYHPKIRSETWPRTPFEGDCWIPEADAGKMGVCGATAAGTTGVLAPGRRNAEAEGASLIGVPTVGVDGSAPRGVP